MFAQAVLDRYIGFQGELFTTWFARTDLSTVDQLTGYFKDMSQISSLVRASRPRV